MTGQAQLLPGTLDLLILKAVSLGPLHGYGVLLRIEQISRGALLVEQGALYPALYRLVRQGLLKASWGTSDNNRRAKFYELTRSIASAFFHRSRIEGEMDEELRSHIQSRADDLERSGVSRTEAKSLAQLEFGGYQKFKEECREERGGFWIETVWTDVRFALRMLRRSPGFTAVAILTLALGIGANTAIFSVVNAVLLRPLPYPNAKRLAMIWSTWGNETRGPASGPELIELRNRTRAFEEIGGIWVTSGTITGTVEPEQVRLALTTANFLPLLAEKPQLGRFFAPGEDRRGAAPLMILTDGLWRRQFAANPGIVGVQVFIPFLNDLEKQSRDTGYIRMVGRLRGASRWPKRKVKRNLSPRSFAVRQRNTQSSRCT